MSANIEIKARVADRAALEARVRRIATEGPTEIAQDDSFLHCAHGRLKLRRFAADRGELIFYRRDDVAGPKRSYYLRSPTSDPDALLAVLTEAHGLVGRVRKQRTLYLVGRTRVHLDVVAGLGDFMELEVVLGEHEAPEAGQREAEHLMEQLGIAPADLLEGAYLDLLAARQR